MSSVKTKQKNFRPITQFLSLIPFCIVIGLSLSGIILLQRSTIPSKDAKLTKQEYQTQEQDENSQLNFFSRVPNLGFENVLADWLYLQFIQYFGDNDARDKVGYSLTENFFSQLIQRDPRFTDAVFKLDTATSLFAGSPQKSVELLHEALQKIPPKFTTNIPPYYLWRAKGNNELLFLGDTQAAKSSYTKSIEAAKAYDDDDSKRIIEISQRSIQFLEKNPDSKLARIGAWVGVLSNRPDDKTVKRVIQEIKTLGGKVTVTPEGKVTVEVPQNMN